MQKPDSFPCCSMSRSAKIKLLGREIAVKNYICSPDGVHYRPKEGRIRLQLSILLTRYCDARCPFCIAAPTDDPAALDPAALEKILRLLRQEDRVRGISITGGEPFTRPELLDQAVSMSFRFFGHAMEVTINTNGTGLAHLCGIRELEHVDTVHISRHHWLDSRNEALFGRRMPSAEELRAHIAAVPLKGLFVLNCMLLRGWVEKPEDARRYMDFAIGLGASKVSFITGTPVNDFVRQRRVPYEAVLRDDDPSLLFTRGFRDYSCCRCRDGVYVSPQGRLIEFYGRHTEPGGCDYCRGLVLTPEGALTAGFGGPVLYRA